MCNWGTCGGNNWWWIIILILLAGGFSGCGCDNDCGCGNNWCFTPGYHSFGTRGKMSSTKLSGSVPLPPEVRE